MMRKSLLLIVAVTVLSIVSVHGAGVRPELPTQAAAMAGQASEQFCITVATDAGATSVCDDALRIPVLGAFDEARGGHPRVISVNVDADCGCQICYEYCWAGSASVCYTYCTCSSSNFYGPGC